MTTMSTAKKITKVPSAKNSHKLR